MPVIRQLNHRLVLLSCLACSVAIASVAGQKGPTHQIVTAAIRLDERSMIIVPVSINGSGPFDFMLDTGCAKTIVDRKLAGELGLARVDEKTVVGVIGSAKMPVVHVDSLSVAGATVLDGDVFVTDRAGTVTSRVRGVLGEDFLRNFDLLIDYRHQLIRLESAPGSLATIATGEHLPVRLTATYDGKPTRNRLIVSGRIAELGDAAMSLLLDSGTNQLTLFKDHLGPGESQTVPIWTASFSQWGTSEAAARRIRSLRLGSKSVSDLIVIALSRRAEFDSDGLIPTSLFHSIFISHAGGFVILDPMFPKTDRDMPVALAAR